jgi:hypothetical protein
VAEIDCILLKILKFKTVLVPGDLGRQGAHTYG